MNTEGNMPKEGSAPGEKKQRRPRLTLAERLADIDDSRAVHQEALDRLNEKRAQVIATEEARVRDMQKQIDAATGPKQGTLVTAAREDERGAAARTTNGRRTA